jgi:hypothetical protein
LVSKGRFGFPEATIGLSWRTRPSPGPTVVGELEVAVFELLLELALSVTQEAVKRVVITIPKQIIL